MHYVCEYADCDCESMCECLFVIQSALHSGSRSHTQIAGSNRTRPHDDDNAHTFCIHISPHLYDVVVASSRLNRAHASVAYANNRKLIAVSVFFCILIHSSRRCLCTWVVIIWCILLCQCTTREQTLVHYCVRLTLESGAARWVRVG